jgi:hypothetical protein
MGYRARPFVAAQDREALLGLWRENLSDKSLAAKLDARFRWLYEASPTHALRTFLVVDDATNAVLGCSSLLPHAVSVDGKLVSAAIGVDLAVAKGHRIAGPAVVLQRAVVNAIAAQEDPKLGAFCFSYPNDGALPIVKRVGYKPVAVTAHAVKPARTGYKLDAKIPFPALRKPAAFLGDRALAAWDLTRLARAPVAHRVEVLAHADERFDALYNELRERIPVLGDRRSAFLNWRYVSCPTRAHTLLAISDRAGARVLAYAVVTPDANTAVLVDFLARDDASAVALFVHLSAHVRAQRLDSIYASYVASPELTDTLVRAGFYPRGAERTFIAYPSPHAPSAVAARILDASAWQIFDGELDL